MPSSYSKILLLGDSLTQTGWSGWVGELAHAYQRRADVINRGMSGYNTKWYLEYTKDSDVWKQGDTVKMITIFFGANDAACEKLNPRQHVSVEDFKTNLEILITKSRQAYGKDVAIIIISAPPVVHEQRLAYQKQRFGDKATGKLERNLQLSEEYANAAEQVASLQNIKACVNLWKLMQLEQNWHDFFYDGLHFTRVGGEFVAKAVLKEISAKYASLSVTPCPITGYWATSAASCPDLPHDGPHHDEIDYLDHEKAFLSSFK